MYSVGLGLEWKAWFYRGVSSYIQRDAISDGWKTGNSFKLVIKNTSICFNTFTSNAQRTPSTTQAGFLIQLTLFETALWDIQSRLSYWWVGTSSVQRVISKSERWKRNEVIWGDLHVGHSQFSFIYTLTDSVENYLPYPWTERLDFSHIFSSSKKIDRCINN